MRDSGRDGIGPNGRSWHAVRGLAAVLVMLALSLPAAAGSGRVKKRDSAIDFTANLDKAIEQARADDKPVYLAFGAVWCPVCRHLEEVTLREPPMQALADDFIWGGQPSPAAWL